MPKHNFEASNEKIKRAERKFKALKARINTFAESQIETFSEIDGELKYIKARLKSPLSIDIMFEVEEICGQLRDSLDKMVADIVVINGQSPSGVSFPFGGLSPDGKPFAFPTGREDRLKKKLTAAQWDLILSYKPYPGGNDTLWGVNRIANTKKHGQGLLQVSAGVVPGVMTLGMDASVFQHANRNGGVFHFNANRPEQAVLSEDEPVATVMQCNRLVPNANTEITGTVVFGELEPVTGKNALTTINEQIRLVKAIVRSFRDI